MFVTVQQVPGRNIFTIETVSDEESGIDIGVNDEYWFKLEDLRALVKVLRDDYGVEI